MAGKGNDERDAAGWLGGVLAALAGEIDNAIEDLAKAERTPGDVAAVDRRARAVANLARAARYVAGLSDRRRGRSRPEDDNDEDQMSEGDREHITPEVEAELRAELQSRIDHLWRLRERKRLERPDADAGFAPGDQGGAEAA